MRITTTIVWDIETEATLVHEWYEYVGPIVRCCSGGDSTAAGLEKSQAAMTNTLNQDYSLSFAEQQSVLGSQIAKMNYIAANPMGYTPQQLAAARTSINEGTATAAKQAMGSAAAFAAAHGGADVGSGAVGEIAGQIGSEAALSKSQQLSALNISNEETKQKNFWNAISGLNSAGSELGGASGTAIGGAGNAAQSSVDAGKLLLASQQAGWSDAFGVVSGVGSMMSGIGGLKG